MGEENAIILSNSVKEKLKSECERDELLNEILHLYEYVLVLDMSENRYYTIKSSYESNGECYLMDDKKLESFLTHYVHPEDRRAYRECFEDTVLRKHIQKPGDKIRIIFRKLDDDNKYRYHELVIYGYRDIYSDQLKCIMTICNVDDMKRAQQEQKKQTEQALQEAQKANQAKSHFLCNVSHDIRTPLNTIIGLTELSIEKFKDEDTVYVEQGLKKIQVASHHLLGLVNDILDMGKIENGNLDLIPREMSMVELMNNIDVIMTENARGKQIQYEHILGADEYLIWGDEMKLQQIIMNIVGNAVKYTQLEGKVTVKDSFIKTADSNKVWYILRCMDNGIGMTKEFVKHIFEPYERGEESTNHFVEGSGLGMAISKKLLDAMNGTIQIESELGEGTLVTIRIPFQVAEKKEQIPQKEHKDILLGKRVLLAEDNLLNMEIAIAFLKDLGAEVEVAVNGTDVIRKFQETELGYYHLIFMDIRMPEMDGIEATRKIRKMSRSDAKNIPIIAMTANVFAEEIEECKRAGMNGHICKPIDRKKLREITAMVMEKE
ncbi:MAG: ATP-binding protein [Lachnospiraceae bacterium]|nr:ATP-binding protein [Lachnospiraceae bacterium]